MKTAFCQAIQRTRSPGTPSWNAAHYLIGALLVTGLSVPPATADDSNSPKPLSAASKRALNYTKGPDWFCEFRTTPVTGDLAYEKGVHRRDPSAVIQVGELYYVWYSKSPGESAGFGSGDPTKKVFPWDLTEVWYATSKNGYHWTEEGMAVGRGPQGAYDDRSVFTPEILAHEDKFYLVYQTVKAPYVRRVKNQIGMAIADSPDGPWKKLKEPILSPSDTGEWLGEEDNRFLVKKRGNFDSHKVHDPCLVPYKGKFWLYYKGEIMGEQMTFGGREIKWGVALADRPEGPYVKSKFNPVTNSGHEVCVWEYRGGIAALLTTDGPEKNTIQFAPDGINFEIQAVIKNPPHALGPFRTADHDKRPLEGLQWGLCHTFNWNAGGWGYIQRFHVDETLKNYFLEKTTYE